jgi:hypothetical protein
MPGHNPTSLKSVTKAKYTLFLFWRNGSSARGEVYPNHAIQGLAFCALIEEQRKERLPYIVANAMVVLAREQSQAVDGKEFWKFTSGSLHLLPDTTVPFCPTKADH